jgi:hypothetical protein
VRVKQSTHSTTKLPKTPRPSLLVIKPIRQGLSRSSAGGRSELICRRGACRKTPVFGKATAVMAKPGFSGRAAIARKPIPLLALLAMSALRPDSGR